MEGGNSSYNNNNHLNSTMINTTPTRASSSSASRSNPTLNSPNRVGSSSRARARAPGLPPTPPPANSGSSSSNREHELYVPIANVIRIMRRILPAHAKISDEAKETVQESVSEFISLVTDTANQKCHEEHRRTVTADDVIYALRKLGFEDYAGPLSLYLDRIRVMDANLGLSRRPPSSLGRHAAQGLGPMVGGGYGLGLGFGLRPAPAVMLPMAMVPNVVGPVNDGLDTSAASTSAASSSEDTETDFVDPLSYFK